MNEMTIPVETVIKILTKAIEMRSNAIFATKVENIPGACGSGSSSGSGLEAWSAGWH